MTASLRDLEASDAEWLDTWLPRVAGLGGYKSADAAAFLGRAKKELRFKARVIIRDSVDVGLSTYSVRIDATAMIELIATPAEHARKGVGMAAAALIEDELCAAGATTIFAPAPAANGISMYFWIRLGYAPILRADWPCERDGVAWLRRSPSEP